MSMGLTSVNIIRSIDRASIDSIKTAIFENAQQKSALVAKNDVMTQARNEFRTKSNPFSFDISAANKDSNSSTSAWTGDNQDKKESDEKKISLKNKISLSNEMQTQAIQESVMLQARKQLTGSADLMKKLSFLKTQTAISSYSARV